jgi:hypothetical protein
VIGLNAVAKQPELTEQVRLHLIVGRSGATAITWIM